MMGREIQLFIGFPSILLTLFTFIIIINLNVDKNRVIWSFKSNLLLHKKISKNYVDKIKVKMH